MRAGPPLAVLAFASACGTDCPEDTIDVRTYAGAPITRTAITCTGSIAEAWESCLATDLAHMTPAFDPTCGTIDIWFGPDSGDLFVLSLTIDDDQVTVAHVDVRHASDQPGGQRPVHTLVSGHVLPEVAGQSSRNAGAFSVTFAEGAISGQYDVQPP